MILAIDIGNSSSSFGLFKGYSLALKKKFETKRIVSAGSGNSILKNFLKAFCNFSFKKGSKIEGVCISSVVPAASKVIIKLVREVLNVSILNIDCKTASGINIKIKYPRQLGADRIVNAACAHHFFGGNCIVIDMGTATTLDCISKKGDYEGGMIMPGIGISSKALHAYTAKLPEINFCRPKKAIGKDTAQCICSGIYYGNIGMIERTIEACKRELGLNSTVILTGGYGGLFFKKIRSVNYFWPELTLVGLRLIWELNKGY